MHRFKTNALQTIKQRKYFIFKVLHLFANI